MKDNKKFWQRFAKLYSPFMERGNRELYDRICEEVKPYLNKDMQVLELACGSGQLSFRLAENVKFWQATDYSENMIAEAKKRPTVKTLSFEVQDATNLPYADNTFDAVMIANALHIMPEPDKAMKEIYRVLKSDGVLFAPTFVHDEVKNRFRLRMLEIVGFKSYSKWKTDDFTLYVEGYGFNVISKTVMSGKPTPLCSLIAKRR